MVLFRCFVQAGQIGGEQHERLTGQLNRLAHENFPDSGGSIPVDWVEVPEGFGFTAGQPSQSSVVVSAVPDETPQDTRVQFMRGICDAWSEETGCSVNDVLVTAVDLSLAMQAQK